jgi:hypothetical protein
LFYYFSSSSSSFIWGFLHCPDWFSWWIPSNLCRERCGWLTYYPRWRKKKVVGLDGGWQGIGSSNTQTTSDWLFQLRESTENRPL